MKFLESPPIFRTTKIAGTTGFFLQKLSDFRIHDCTVCTVQWNQPNFLFELPARAAPPGSAQRLSAPEPATRSGPERAEANPSGGFIGLCSPHRDCAADIRRQAKVVNSLAPYSFTCIGFSDSLRRPIKNMSFPLEIKLDDGGTAVLLYDSPEARDEAHNSKCSL